MFSDVVSRFFFSRFLLEKSRATRLAYLGVFTALAVVANIFSIDPDPSLKISFTYLVAFFAGTFFGPVSGFAICFLGDFLGFLINAGGGTYWILTGVCSGLFAFIPGVVMNFLPLSFRGAVYLKAAISVLLMYALVTCGLGAYSNYLYVKLVVYAGREYGKAFYVYLGGKIVFASIVSALNYALVFLLIPLLNSVKPLKIKIA